MANFTKEVVGGTLTNVLPDAANTTIDLTKYYGSGGVNDFVSLVAGGPGAAGDKYFIKVKGWVIDFVNDKKTLVEEVFLLPPFNGTTYFNVTGLTEIQYLTDDDFLNNTDFPELNGLTPADSRANYLRIGIV